MSVPRFRFCASLRIWSQSTNRILKRSRKASTALEDFFLFRVAEWGNGWVGFPRISRIVVMLEFKQNYRNQQEMCQIWLDISSMFTKWFSIGCEDSGNERSSSRSREMMEIDVPKKTSRIFFVALADVLEILQIYLSCYRNIYIYYIILYYIILYYIILYYIVLYCILLYYIILYYIYIIYILWDDLLYHLGLRC